MNNKNRFQDYFGILTMPEKSLDKLEYILVNDKDNGGYEFNLTEFLEANQGKNIGLAIGNRYHKDIFCEVGKIEIINGVIMVDARDISKALWNKVKWNNKYHLLSIRIDTKPELENMEAES